MSTIQRMKQPFTQKEVAKALSPFARNWFLSKFESFSPPQQYSIVNIKSRKNTLISAPTGTGKTFSAFAAILDDLIQLAQLNKLEDKVYCVYVSPLKALNNDIENNLKGPLQELEQLSEQPLNIRVGVRTGDTKPYDRQKMLKKPPHILITTPESLAIMLTSPKFSQLLKNIDWAIIDEIHAFAENKRGTQLSLLLERLQQENEYTRIGLSATVAPLEEVAQFLVGQERNCDIADVSYVKKLDLEVISPVQNIISSHQQELLDAQYNIINEQIQENRTTLIFTNTRAATERVVHELKRRFPENYTDEIEAIDDESDETGEVKTTISAHHGSLSKAHRLEVETKLRQGKLKCVVSSTSLELGIDIGYIDLVLLLGSPKSVARALQRIGRSGHKLHETARGKILILNRDDLVECSLLAKAALEGDIDRINIPKGCLDVLAQEIYGIAISGQQHVTKLYRNIKRAYPYKNLSHKSFIDTVNYLAGHYAPLEDRHVYAKIWFDEDTGMIGRKGRTARLIYMTNVGTIPDQTNVVVKIGMTPIGSISEPFLESLKKGDIFVLGGATYQFRYARGMTAQVVPIEGKRPTVPAWFSEMLPLSFDLSTKIRVFRKYTNELFEMKKSKKEIIEYLKEYLPIDEQAATSIYEYHKQQFMYAQIAHENKLVIEFYQEGTSKYAIFHALYGRRVNDVLSRAIAYALGRIGGGSAEIGISDNGFFLRFKNAIKAKRAFKLLKDQDLQKIMEQALDHTEVLQRRFRHCAGRSLMILRSYKGNKKTVGRQQVSSRILISAVKRIGTDFPIYKEAQREVLEDLMDLTHAKQVMGEIQEGKIKVEEINTTIPSPFAFQLILQGFSDIMKLEDRQEFLRRLHKEVMLKIALQGRKKEVEEILHPEDFSYDTLWKEQQKQEEEKEEDEKDILKEQLFRAAQITQIENQYVYETQRLINGETTGFPQSYIAWLTGLLKDSVPKAYDDKLVKFLKEKLPEISWQ